MSQRLQAVRGMNDVLPQQTLRWQRLLSAARAALQAYGFREILLPVVERTELFRRAVGETTDVVEKEMYTFQDRSGDWLSLRPEGTAGCVRAGVEHGLLHNQQQRLWYAGPMFRHERPQAGRYRQFYQIGVEAYGIPGPQIDVEVIAASARLWRMLGLRDLRLEINTLGGEARVRYREKLLAYLERFAADLDGDSQRRLHSNPLRILDSKIARTQTILAGAPSILDFLDAPARTYFDALQQGLTDLGIEYTVNPRLVRGLDYYTDGVFEWITEALGAQGTVCAGGRYDRLVEQLGGGAVPAVGWASGVERLVLLLEQAERAAGIAIDDGAPHAYFCWLDQDSRRQATQQGERLRDQLPWLRLVVHAGAGMLKAQLKRADGCGARLALILGGREAAQGTVQVKSLCDGQIAEVAMSRLGAELARRLAPGGPAENSS
ncbi:MAG: histidine--tRNA ligase [Gammaproteobacteria bacterium]|nr:histidine--tRNA ligase [Gammaproteobacteria bacterium]